jgi:N-methylhydantoinase A
VQLAHIYAELDARCAALMASEPVARSRIERHHHADVCYIGQSYHLEVALELKRDDVLERLTRDFYEAHDRVYGHSAPGPIQFVNLRAVHQAQVEGPDSAADYEPSAGDAFKGTRAILTAQSGKFVQARVYERIRIAPDTRFEGPAIFEQSDTTTVLDCGWQAEIDSRGSLMLTAAQ